MSRRKTICIVLAFLLLFVFVNPVTATPAPDLTTTTPTNDNVAITANEPNTETTATAGLEQALADADAAIKQAQAARIRQELDMLGDELERLNTDYYGESAKLAAIEGSLNETREKLRWLEAELDAQREIINGRVTQIYKHGDMEPLEAIVNNGSFAELYTRLSFLIKISEQDAELLQKLRDQKEKIETTKKTLDQLYTQQREITAELEGRKKAIEEKLKQEAMILASIDPQIQAILDAEQAKQQQEQAELVKQLSQKSENDRLSLEPGTIGFEAIQYIGIPYVWGGEDPEIGLDCSGLVKIVFAKFGVNLPHYSRAQAELGAPVDYEEMQPGDLVFFGNPIHHVGIYLGEGYYIHAPKRNDFVKISRLSDRNDFARARRIISIIPSN
ncbi:MAG: C40 family peptidase [Firmicutes bacterium]|nr:C40 family peptidase [Bacillota bacterium]